MIELKGEKNWAQLFLTTELLLLVGASLILFFIVTIVYNRRKAKGGAIVAPQIMRFLIIPSTTVYLFCRFILGLPREHISIKVTETILVLAAVSFIIGVLNHLVFSEHNILDKKKSIPKLGRDLIHIILLLLSSMIVVSTIWGFDIGNMLTAFGLGSLVVGLALQEPLGNLFQGVSLLLANPFQKGDWVQIGSEQGKVREFNWRSVKLVNRNNELIVIPNNLFAKEKIKNLSRPSKVHAEVLHIGFSYNDDPKVVKEVLLNLSLESESVLNRPQPEIHTVSYEDFYIKYAIKIYVRDYTNILDIRDEIMTNIYAIAQQNNLEIPYPIQRYTRLESKK